MFCNGTTIGAMRSRLARLHGSFLAACLCGAWLAAGLRAADNSLPAGLADEDFWRMLTSFSERAGTFPSDNLLSNETSLQQSIPDLTRTVPAGGVYLGVGPEQNF